MIALRDAGSGWTYAEALGTTWAGVNPPYFIASRTEGTFLEQIARGAFSDATTGREASELRVEHLADGPVLASTNTNTLHFRDDDRGLLLTAALRKSDPNVAAAIAKVHAGSYSGVSVGMVVRTDKWSTASDGTALRTVTDASLREVSFVNRPANTNAKVLSIRKELRAGSGEVIEYRSFYTDGFEQRIGIRPGPSEIPEDGVLCPACNGGGRQGNEMCVVCRGFGWADKAHVEALKDGGGMVDDARAQVHEKYTAAELVALGNKGQAFRHPDGSYAFPTADHEDIENAVKAVAGRSRKSPPEKVRVYIMNRAKALGLASLIPATWRPDGSVKPADRSVADLELQAIRARGDALEAEAHLYLAQYRVAHPLPDLDYDAIRREGAELELEALALVAGKRSNRGTQSLTKVRRPR